MTEERPGSADDRPAPEPPAEEQATEAQTDPREAASGEEEPEREWWEDEGMPWKKKPGRADYACLAWFGVIAVFSLILIPTRAWLLGVAPDWLAMITGGRTAVAASGAIASTGEMPHWPIVLILASVLSLKFDWIYWWAGRLWGRSILDIWVHGKSPRTQRRFERAWHWARRYETLAIVVTFLPIPIPAAVVYAALGAAGTSLRKFLTVGFLSALVTTAGYMALGYWIGEPAVAVVDTYGTYLWYVSIAIIVGMLSVYFYRERKRATAPTPEP